MNGTIRSLLGMTLGTSLLCAGGCGESRAPVAGYMPPDTGTVLRYAPGLTNRIVANDGLRMEFVDQDGRIGRRMGWFITEYPGEVTVVDTVALRAFWPLRVGKEATVKVQRGPETWRWELRVTGRQMVGVPFGQYDSFLVQAIEAPETVRNPATAYTAAYRFWYSPDVDAVVRFQTTYMSGPAQGRYFGGELSRIVYPGQEDPDTMPAVTTR